MTSSEEVDAIPATGNGLGFKQLPWILINININQYKILLIIHHDTDQVSWSKHRENRPQAGWVDLVVVHWQRLKPLELPGQDQAESHGTPLHAHTHSAFITSPRPAASWSKKPLSGPLSFCNVFGFCWPILIISTPLQSELISAQIWNKIYHLTLIALSHYRVKYEQVQFCKKRRHCDMVLFLLILIPTRLHFVRRHQN